MRKFQIVFILLSLFLVSVFLKFGWSRVIFVFADVFNPKAGENELKKKLISLEESLSSISWQNNLGVKSGNEAEIIGYLIGSGGKKVFIDKGSVNGINVGDWVLVGDKTLFGRVERVDEDFSVVKTIFDSSLKVASRVQADSATSGQAISSQVFSGVSYFDGINFVMDFLPKDAEVAENSFVESSGRDGVFRSGFYLGMVLSLENSSEANLKKAVVESPLKISDVYKVRILKNFLY
jgi:cell shape-determining protein MreC